MLEFSNKAEKWIKLEVLGLSIIHDRKHQTQSLQRAFCI